jgi:hypothetical protein
MNTAEFPNQAHPQCCAHLITWHDGPLTSRTSAFATREGLRAESSASECGTALETNTPRFSESRVVRM